MRIFVTAGNTQVPIDRVRCITNVFTGRTGASIALAAFRRGHGVTLATSHPEAVHDLRRRAEIDAQRWQCHVYRTFEDLEEIMARHIAQFLKTRWCIVPRSAITAPQAFMHPRQQPVSMWTICTGYPGRHNAVDG